MGWQTVSNGTNLQQLLWWHWPHPYLIFMVFLCRAHVHTLSIHAACTQLNFIHNHNRNNDMQCSQRERERKGRAVLFMCLGSWVMLYFSLVSLVDRIQETLLWCFCFNNSSLQLLMSHYCSSCQKVAFTSQASPWSLPRLWKDGCEACKPGLLAL